MALSTHEILQRLEQNAPVIRRYGVRSLGLFGSGTRGTAQEHSDLDFVVEFETKSFDAYMDLKVFLERLFGCAVDLVRDICEIYRVQGFTTQVLAASIRNPLHVIDAAKAGAHVVTMPFAVLEQLMKHPLTDLGLKKFLDDWAKLGAKI